MSTRLFTGLLKRITILQSGGQEINSIKTFCKRNPVSPAIVSNTYLDLTRRRKDVRFGDI